MPLRKWKEIQKMLRSECVIAGLILAVSSLWAADDSSLWREYGLIRSQNSTIGKLPVTTYQMKDLTGALAAWEWLRSADGRTCELAEFCTAEPNQTVISQDNYVVAFHGKPTKAQVDNVLNSLPNKTNTSLPAILTFLPHQGLVPDSARYILGPASLKAFAPELESSNPGFDQDAEAQVAEYRLGKSDTPVHLALFYYPAPGMARLHTVNFKLIPDTYVKRSGVLVAVVYGGPTMTQADTLLSRVEYEAKITWNETPPPSPIKPLYQLLMNIMYLTIVLSGVCLLAGLMYAGMRIYRRRYGTLEAEEAMTTLHISGE